MPQLGTLIFATTANKDAKIEEYVRLKNEETDFNILLYSWEDIADLIEEYKNTYDWYVRDIMHKTKYDFRVVFNDFQQHLIIKPLYEKKIVKHEYVAKSPEDTIDETWALINKIQKAQRETKLTPPSLQFINPFKSEYVNKSYVEFEVILENSGNTVIENWSFNLCFKSGVAALDDESGGFLMGDISMVNINKNDPRWIDKKEKSITYTPKENSVLVQGDNRFIRVAILPELKATEITFEWNIIARDFSKKGLETIFVEPTYKTISEMVEVINPQDEKEEIEINYYRVKNDQ